MTIGQEISAFLRRHDMPPSRFGRDFVGDPKFVEEVWTGRIPRQKMLARLREAMRRYDEENLI